MNKNEVENILEKYKAGTASEADIALLQSWSISYTEPGEDLLPMDERIEAVDEIWDNLQQSGKSKEFQLWPRIAAAASILLLITFGGYFLLHQSSKTGNTSIAHHDIPAGTSAATLTLASGKQIKLNATTEGQIANESGISISKTKSGELIYKIVGSENIRENRNQFNTLETQKGEQYQVILPDGSHVWLNAASSLRYPVVFTGNVRVVEFSGEAYFEIAQQKLKPFRIITRQQLIEVLGTHFNVNAYNDEPLSKTTLFEGSVRVMTPSLERSAAGNIVLKPGEQSILIGNQVEVSKANIEEAMAWKNGQFVFESENIKSIMRKISRWYNVEIIYEGEVTSETFSGVVNRFENVSQVLKKLALTNRVHFRIEERRIIVKN